MKQLSDGRQTKSAERIAFGHFLRTGRRIAAVTVERKYNHNHDPRNGQFTFGPGGGASALRVASVQRAGAGMTGVSSRSTADFLRGRGISGLLPSREDSLSGAPIATRTGQAVHAVEIRPEPRLGRGGNGGPPMTDPMTLEAVFPNLSQVSGGSLIAMTANILDFAGPAQDLTRELTQAHTKVLISQIEAIDPSYRFESLGEPQTVQGQANQFRKLRIDRARAYYKVKGEVRPLQVETLRFLQERVDVAYEEGAKHFEAGRLQPKLSRNEAIGNYVDKQVRLELRDFFRNNGISIERGQSVQVNRRAAATSDGSYTVPDSRVGNVAFDVSMTAKTLSTAQVRGFFRSDFQPTVVVIVRPSQLGSNHTYAITKPSRL